MPAISEYARKLNMIKIIVRGITYIKRPAIPEVMIWFQIVDISKPLPRLKVLVVVNFLISIPMPLAHNKIKNWIKINKLLAIILEIKW